MNGATSRVAIPFRLGHAHGVISGPMSNQRGNADQPCDRAVETIRECILNVLSLLCHVFLMSWTHWPIASFDFFADAGRVTANNRAGAINKRRCKNRTMRTCCAETSPHNLHASDYPDSRLAPRRACKFDAQG